MSAESRSELPAEEPPIASFAGAARPLAVVVGGLFALESSESLDAPKFAFFAVAIAALAGSMWHAWRIRDSEVIDEARPWLIASVIIASIVCISLPVAVANGTTVGTWVRDAAPYALVAAAPWLALDLGAAVSPRVATSAIVVAGSMTAVSFAVNWVQRRDMLVLPFDRLVLPSFNLTTALFALAVASSIWGERNRFAWAAGSAIVMGLLLSSGTRTTLALTAVPVVLLADAVRTAGRTTIRRSVVAAAAPLVVAGAFVMPAMLRSVVPVSAEVPPSPPAIATSVPALRPGPSPAAIIQQSSVAPVDIRSPAAPSATQTTVRPAVPDLGDRFGSLGDVATGSDLSLRLRWAQTVSAWTIFADAPVLGRGPGVPIPWVNSDGTPMANFFADTPIAILAKFGVLGIAIWVALGWATILTLSRLRRLGQSGSVARAALLGFATAMIVLAPFGAQLEDKGTGFALILLLGFALSVVRRAQPGGLRSPADG